MKKEKKFNAVKMVREIRGQVEQRTHEHELQGVEKIHKRKNQATSRNLSKTLGFVNTVSAKAVLQ